MLGVQLYDSVDAKHVVKSALDIGFIINCTGDNTLRFVPPLIISVNEINDLIYTLEKIFNEC